MRLPVLPERLSLTTKGPSTRELLADIRTDACDYLRSALDHAEDGQWADALTETQIAEDRLQVAEQLEGELDAYVGA